MIHIDQIGEIAHGTGEGQGIEILAATGHQIDGDAAAAIEIIEIGEMIPVIELGGVVMTLLTPGGE
jgi:hypothetical protein